jgi:cytoskeletal protein CcmA (bactofilin family)
MNKIFKVIWSKSRNCYVVASELAKGHTKASSTGDKTRRLALAAITALILLPVGGFSYAADATIMVEPVGTGSTTAVEVYTKEGIDKGQESLQKDIQKFSKEVQNELLSIGENIQATDGAYVDAFKSVGENLNALDTQVKANADAINEEALKRKYSVTNLEKADAAEAAAREAADTALDTRITNVKEYLEKQTSDNYVSKADAAVQDGAVVKAANTIGDNVTKLDAALANGSTLIDIIKDSTTGMVSSAVTDGNTSTGISQSAKDISLSAAGGTIANAAQNITNTASESITNTVGKTTVTTTDSGTTFENTDHNTAIKEGTVTKTTISGNTIETGQATMDYADVMKDLGVHGNATVDQKLTVKGDSDLQGNANVGKNLTVNGTSDLKGDVTMESNATVEKDLTVEGTTKTEKLVVNNGATVTGGTTTDTLHVTSTSTFDGQATFKDIVTMEKDLSVGGYKGETATAIGAFYRPNENVMVNVSSSFGTGENMYGGGISLRIGQGGNKARRNATNGLTEREKAQQKQIDYLTSRLDALLSVINPNMSKDFPDVPENHWAYEAVSKLAGNGIIQGYEDGKYHGERTMTRYEMAEIIYNALSKGAKAEKKLVEEFKPELQAMAAQKKA